MSLLQNSNAISAGGYDINNSLRFRSSASAYLSRTFSASGTTATFSVWVKRGALGSYQTIFGWSNLSNTSFGIDLNLDTLAFYSYSSAFILNLVTTQVLRDPSAWYHIVCVIDTTQATAANRAKIYINGSQVTALSTATYPAQNTSLNLATSTSWSIGRVASATTHYDGYMAEWNFIDGQALTPSSFGETDTTTGSWKPKAYTGTYGTNGFYLKFSDIATTSGSNAGLGKDFSGNSNYWTTNNISVTSGTTYDAMTDSPTNTSATVANYCVMNPLNKLSAATTSNGNLNVQTSGSSGATINGTFGVSSGKWYWETILNAATDATIFGIDEITELPSYPGVSSTSYSYYPVSALKINNAVQTSYGVTATTNDVIGCALDMDNGKIWWSKNGTWMASGDPVAGTNAAFTGITGTKTPAVGDGSSGSNVNVEYNFGQRPFSYTPPTGYKALNTYNLPDSTIKKGNLYMDASLWTGNGASNRTITNTAGFKPDLVWTKGRNTASWNHFLNDSVRGFPNYLISSSTGAEGTTSPAIVSSAASNGFVIQANGNSNNNGDTYVGWQWQAGQGTTSNITVNQYGSTPSIASTVSVNTTAGFSVVTWANTSTNATIGHGLGVAPKMIIAKNRTGTADSWLVYHSALGATKFLRLESTAAEATNIVVWNNTAPTSTVFSIGTGLVTGNFVAYCWAEIAGFSKFGSYTGNGSADGPFVFTNFLPRWVLIKQSSSAGNSWQLIDTARETTNPDDTVLFPNLSNAEGTGNATLDFLSNGFKVRTTDGTVNTSSSTYIYAAFAENPFKNANAR